MVVTSGKKLVNNQDAFLEVKPMLKDLKNWWNTVPKNQKAGLIVLAAFVLGVVIFSFGTTIGAAISRAL